MQSFNTEQTEFQDFHQNSQKNRTYKQVKLFTKKNFLILKRDFYRILILLISPFMACMTITLLQHIANSVKDDLYSDKLENPILSFGKIDRCWEFNCTTIAYHIIGPQEPYINYVIEKVREQNDLPIDQVRMVSQGDPDNFQNYLNQNKNQTKIGIIFCTSEWKVDQISFPCKFDDKNKQLIFYSIVNNHTIAPFNVFGVNQEKLEKDNLPFQLKLQIDQAVLSYFKKDDFKLDVTIQSFPTVTSRFIDNLSVNRPFIWTIPVFLLFIYLTQEIIKDKQIKIGIKQFIFINFNLGLIVVGLQNKSYWISWQITGIILNMIIACLQTIMGDLFQFQMFKQTPFIVMTILFFSFGFTIQQLGFLISTISNSQSQGMAIMYTILIVNILTCLLFQQVNFYYLINSNIVSQFYRNIINLFNFIPTYHFNKIFGELQIQTDYHFSTKENRWVGGQQFNWEIFYSDVVGQVFGERSQYHCPSTFLSIIYLFILAFIFMLFTMYFDYVLSSNGGKSRSLLFFLQPSYWKIRVFNREYISLQQDEISIYEQIIEDFNETSSQNIDPKLYEKGISIIKVSKTYKKYPFNIQSKSDHQALKNYSLFIKNNELMAILGPNGAGKSTLFSLITGLNEMDKGKILINQLNIETQFEEIRKQIGFCPQFDLLWDNLTAAEHLEIFSELKDIPQYLINDEVNDRLQQVNLLENKNSFIYSFSGGMKRRISLAISTLGNPKVIILDEPTTGMDPKSKREAWSLIKQIKQDKCILLTTHDMEEADILNDRIAIMKNGSIIALGSSQELKNKFGSGYNLNIVVKDNFEKSVLNFIEKKIEICKVKQQNKRSFIVNIQNQQYKQLQDFIEILESEDDSINENIQFRNSIQDWGISQTNMEQVFLNLMSI